MSWTRPADVPIGQVWSRFKGREREGKPAKMYQIRDMDESYRAECLDLMQASFLRDEPLSKALSISSDSASIQSIRSNWCRMMDQNVSIACFTEVDGQPDELVAFNIVYVATKGDPDLDVDKISGEGWKKLLKTLLVAENLVDVYSIYRVDTYMSSSGLTVLPEHRGQNIGARMMAAREPMCKAFDIHAACTVFTAITSQVLAEKCGFKLLAEMPYTAMMEYGIDLSASDTLTAKVMGLKYAF